MTAPATGVHRVTARRWPTMSLMEQLAHVGSEVERSIRAHDGGQDGRLRNAVDRALELFDLAAADERWRGPRRREILRAREEFCRLLYGDDVPAGAVRSLQNYFLAFAVAARRSRDSSTAM